VNIAPLFGPPQPLIHLASLSLFRTGDQRAKPKFIGFKRYPSTHIATARLVLPISGTPNCSSRSALATKLEPGAYIPFHEHPEIKQALILECASRITMAGDYIQRKQVDCTIARRLGGAALFAGRTSVTIGKQTAGFRVHPTRAYDKEEKLPRLRPPRF